MGVISPLGNDVPSFWNNLIAGRSGIDLIRAFDVSDCPVKIGAEVRDFNPGLYFDVKEARRLDRVTQLGVAAAREAVQSSGLTQFAFDSTRIGVVTGSGIGGIQTLEEQHGILIEKGRRAVSPFFIPMMIPDIISGQISIRWGFEGPNYSISSACATATHSIGIALRHIVSGDADVMLCGGAEASITPLALAGFTNMKALSRRNEEPSRASRPFDRGRDGFIMGEGAGVIILEELQHALRRDAPILAEVIGFGFSADAFHITAPHPQGRGAALSMQRAIQMSGLPAEAFGYINAHGTSTELNDKLETIAIKLVFGEQARRIRISSTKSMTGHLLGAAGAVEFIALVEALRHQLIPPTINYEEPDPDCDLDYTPNQAIQFNFEAGLSNNFGFGGHNAVVAVRRFASDGSTSS